MKNRKEIFCTLFILSSSVLGVAQAITDTGDKVGIGVNPPLEKLHINGSVRGGGYNGTLRISTPTGYLDAGPMNSEWSHFQTDRPQFYFNKSISVDGTISSYGGNNLILRTSSYPRIFVNGSTGYVAIGEYTPTAKLHIQQVANGWTDGLRFSNNGRNWDIVSDAGGDRLLISKNQSDLESLSIYNGAVGIGTISPQAKMHIVKGGQSLKFLTGENTSSYSLDIGLNDNGVNIANNSAIRGFNIYNARQSIKLLTGNSSSYYSLGIGVNDNGVNIYNDSEIRGFNFGNARGTHLSISENGNVGIGATSLTAKLTVGGDIHSREVRVTVNAGSGPDYVFEPTYQLPTLAETEAYIKANKHLPEVPSAKEMEENGINLSEMNMLLLKKVEELTLHLIEQQKQLGTQQKEIEMLKTKLR